MACRQWRLTFHLKSEPEGGDPGEAQGDLHGVLLLLGKPIGVRMGKMASHFHSRYFKNPAETLNFPKSTRFWEDGEAWCHSAPTTSPLTRAPPPPPPPPLATRAALQPPSSHTGQVSSCVLCLAPGVTITHTILSDDTPYKYFLVHCISLCPEQRLDSGHPTLSPALSSSYCLQQSCAGQDIMWRSFKMILY